MSAIQFLTTVSKSQRNASLFKSEDALRQICEKIVIPNLQLSEDLEEMFEMNYVEYVRRDTEGSDYDTRRRAATELVKALAGQFESEVAPVPCLCALLCLQVVNIAWRRASLRQTLGVHCRSHSCLQGMSVRSSRMLQGVPRHGNPRMQQCTSFQPWLCGARLRRMEPLPPTSWSM